jgi:demethylmenaquinone methyltransferase/2-methoxy-6-polyprenyl-1,4-benzoquinol methylase
MFSRIVPCYDILNRILSLGCDRFWRARLAEATRPGPTGRMLDLAAGTFDVALALCARYPDVTVAAVDFCLPMLQKGCSKLRGRNQKRILPIAGNATCLPLPDASVDSIAMAFGIRNIQARHTAFAEMLRVLAPGGLACILEFGSSRERIWGGIYNLYLKHLLPGLGKRISGDDGAYAYLAHTIRDFPDAAALEEELRNAGFARTRFERIFSGIVCLHVAEKTK